MDLGEQVPIGTILDAAKEHEATAIGLSALLVSTSKQMPLAVQELHSQGFDVPVLIGGAAINRNFGRASSTPAGASRGDLATAASSTARTPSRACRSWTSSSRGTRATGSWRRCATRRRSCARRAPSRGAADRRRHGALRGPDRRARPGAAVLGRAGDRRRHGRGLPPPRHPRPVQAALGRAGRQGRRLEGARRDRLPAAAGAHVGRAGLPAAARAAGLLPGHVRRQQRRGLRPRGPFQGPRVASSSRASPRASACASPTSTGPRTAASSTSSPSRPSPPARR